jgi:hypothetical protein
MNLKANLIETIGRSVLVEFNPVCLPDETIQVLSEKESKFILPEVAGKVLAEQAAPSRL